MISARNRELIIQQEDAIRGQNEKNDREIVKERGADDTRDIRSQQNGHRGSVILETDMLERVKQRKEEEEKRINESKKAAAKKLQELEQKINKKKELADDGTEPSQVQQSFKSMTLIGNNNDNRYQSNRADNDKLKKERDNKDAHEYGRGERDAGGRDGYSFRDRDGQNRDGRTDARNDGRGGGPVSSNDQSALFSRQFQTNLPPRFQKQREHGHDRPNQHSGGNDRLSAPGERNNYNMNRGNNASSAGQQNEQKNVPFAQQYDPRYLHSQNYKQQQQPQYHGIKRNPSDENMPVRRNTDINIARGSGGSNIRRRIDSEEEDRFSSSGRESISRSSLGDRPALFTRSISDSSQRKTSVSSEDKPLDNSYRSDRSGSRECIGSWADELESETRQATLKKTSASSDDQPKQILQRVRKVSTDSRSEKERSEEREILANALGKQVSNASDTVKSPGVVTTVEAIKSWADSESVDGTVASQKSLDDVEENLGSNTAIKNGSESSVGDKSPLEAKAIESAEQNPEIENSSVSAKASAKGFGQGQGKDSSLSNDESKQGGLAKRSSPRGGRADARGPPPQRGNTGYQQQTSYNRGGAPNWNRRGPGAGRPHGGGYNDFSDSDASDDEYNRGGRRGDPKRKDAGGGFQQDSGNSRHGPGQHQKETFVPRGEPSRRGRGGGPAFRRNPPTIVKRIDNYGPPSSKSPFGSGDDKFIGEHEKLKQGGERKSISDGSVKQHGKKGDEANESTSEFSDSYDGKSRKGGQRAAKGVPSSNAPATGNEGKPQSSVGQTAKTPGTDTNKGQQPARKDSATKTDSDSVAKRDSDDGQKQQQKANKPAGESPAAKKEDENGVGFGQAARPGNQTGNRAKATPNVQLPKQPAQGVKPPGVVAKGATNSPQTVQTPTTGGTNRPAAPSTQQPGNFTKPGPGGAGVDARNRTQPNKLPPRFAKQQQQQHPTRAGPRDNSTFGQQQINSWDKSSSGIEKGSAEQDNGAATANTKTDETKPNLQGQSVGEKPGQPNASSNSNIKTDNNKVNTIIFENTNFKTMPPIKRQQGGPPGPQQQHQQHQGHPQHQQHQQLSHHHVQMQQNQHQLDKRPEDVFKNASSVGSFQDMLDSQQHQVNRSSMGSQKDENIAPVLQTMTFSKTNDSEYEKDMKLAFNFESEISHLTEDKNGKGGNLCIPPSRPGPIHSAATSQNTISPSIADLSMKITSVKKVWENATAMPTVMENNSQAVGPDDSHMNSNFVTSHQPHMHQFNHAHGNMSHAPGPYVSSFGNDSNSLDQFSKSGQDGDDNVNYNPGGQHMVNNPGGHNAHQNAALKHAAEALATSTNVCKVKPTQQQMHQNSLGLSPPPIQQGNLQAGPQPYYQPSQFGGMSAIPSPPAVLYNSSPMAASQSGLYGHFQIEASRSQFSQYPGHYGAAGNTPYNAYMQTPPNLQTPPTPDMYQSLTSQFRMGATVQPPPFNQTQQLNNPSTVLISSTSNSLMSASVKPSSQQIGAIGSKAGAVGQSPYGQQYMGMYAPQQAPPPPPQIQNNSYYSNSAGQGAFFGAPASGGSQSFSLQANTGMFGGHGGPQTGGPPSNAPPQPTGFNSQFSFAINRQYQGGPSPQNAGAYMKNNQPQQQQPPNQQQQQSHQDSVSSNSFFK